MINGLAYGKYAPYYDTKSNEAELSFRDVQRQNKISADKTHLRSVTSVMLYAIG